AFCFLNDFPQIYNLPMAFVKREIDSVPQNAGYSWLERIVVDYPSMCVEIYAYRLHAFTAFQTLVV
ncbi:MAG TPA: hypothetical protein H9950_12275, partial [Candidatus Bacteroides avicola]|nr:hypothetical protein [Candidatus Bacteroides avicola]